MTRIDMASPDDSSTTAGLDAVAILKRTAYSAPMLTARREVELVRRMRHGDVQARSDLVLAHLRLVIRVARDLEGSEMPLADLAQEGLIGLTKALDRFDPVRGVRVSAFAEEAVRGAMLRAIEQQGRMIRLPREWLKKIAVLRRVRERLATIWGREVSDAEIAELWHTWEGRAPEQLGGGTLNPSEIPTLLALDEQAVLFGLRPSERESITHDSVTLLSAAEERAALQTAVRRLHNDEEEIIASRYGLFGREPEQLHVIADRMHLSREAVRRIEHAALAKLLDEVDRVLGRRRIAD
jgi:RNA polymerase primary sigma factor